MPKTEKDSHNPLWSALARNLTPYVPGEQPKASNLVKLNTNENPFSPSPKVAEAIQAVLKDGANALRLYPDPDSSVLKSAIAERFSLNPEQVFVGNGSDEVLAHIFAAFFKKDRPLFYPDISYSFYPVYANLYGINAQKIPLNGDFEIDPDDYRAPCDGIIFANPNAPTGVFLPLEKIEKLLKEHSSATVVVDEAYIDFGGTSAVCLIEKYENLVVCQTTSKSRALAGLRVGYALAQPSMIEALERVKNSFNSYPIDRLAEAGAVASFNDDVYFTKQCQQIIALREGLVAGLEGLGFSVLPSCANFVLATHQSKPAKEIFTRLREQHIIVRYFDAPRINNHLRITVGTTEQNAALLAALGEVCESL